MKTTRLKVGQKLTAKLAKHLRVGDELTYTYSGGVLKEEWIAARIHDTSVYFKSSPSGREMRWDTEHTRGWHKLTVKKLAKGDSVRTVYKYTGAEIMDMVNRAERLQDACRTLVIEKAELRSELTVLKEKLTQMVVASDESLNASARRHAVWTEVRDLLGMPRQTAWQKSRGY